MPASISTTSPVLYLSFPAKRSLSSTVASAPTYAATTQPRRRSMANSFSLFASIAIISTVALQALQLVHASSGAPVAVTPRQPKKLSPFSSSSSSPPFSPSSSSTPSSSCPWMERNASFTPLPRCPFEFASPQDAALPPLGSQHHASSHSSRSSSSSSSSSHNQHLSYVKTSEAIVFVDCVVQERHSHDRSAMLEIVRIARLLNPTTRIILMTESREEVELNMFCRFRIAVRDCACYGSDQEEEFARVYHHSSVNIAAKEIFCFQRFMKLQQLVLAESLHSVLFADADIFLSSHIMERLSLLPPTQLRLPFPGATYLSMWSPAALSAFVQFMLDFYQRPFQEIAQDIRTYGSSRYNNTDPGFVAQFSDMYMLLAFVDACQARKDKHRASMGKAAAGAAVLKTTKAAAATTTDDSEEAAGDEEDEEHPSSSIAPPSPTTTTITTAAPSSRSPAANRPGKKMTLMSVSADIEYQIDYPNLATMVRTGRTDVTAAIAARVAFQNMSTCREDFHDFARRFVWKQELAELGVKTSIPYAVHEGRHRPFLSVHMQGVYCKRMIHRFAAKICPIDHQLVMTPVFNASQVDADKKSNGNSNSNLHRRGDASAAHLRLHRGHQLGDRDGGDNGDGNEGAQDAWKNDSAAGSDWLGSSDSVTSAIERIGELASLIDPERGGGVGAGEGGGAQRVRRERDDDDDEDKQDALMWAGVDEEEEEVGGSS